MIGVVRVLDRLGFDQAKAGFALRTALAACLALWLAWVIGLEHPQWAAMSVWTASQPLRGQLVEKSLFRFLGTVSGTIAGIAIVVVGQVHPVLLVVGLALWVSVCTAISNLQRGFVSYGTVLAGYTAAMIALLDTAHPENVLHLGLDRMATVLTGVVIATLVGVVFATGGAPRKALRSSANLLVADVLDQRANGAWGQTQTQGAFIARLAEIEEGLDPHGAGSLRSRQEIRATRAVLIATIAVVLVPDDTAPAPETASAMAQAAACLRAGDTVAAAQALRQIQGADPLAEALGDLATSLMADDGAGASADMAERLPVILHRDWIGAREAGLRALVTMLLAGAVWQITGWSQGNFLMLGLSIMVSIFSTFEAPGQMMRWVFLGQAFGLVATLICRWLVWPLAGSEAQLIWLLMPFVAFGGLLVWHRRAARISFDYNMILLLLSQPQWPLSGTFGHSVAAGLGVISAPLVAWGVYSVIYPTDLRRRIDTLVRMMQHDLADLARDPAALSHRRVWRARLYHRTLRLVRMSERYGRSQDQALTQALEVLKAGHAIMRLHQGLAEPGLGDSDRRALQLALRRAAQMETRPEKARIALEKASRRLGCRV